MHEATATELSRYVTTRRTVERNRSVQIFRFHLLAYVLGNAFLGGWNALAYYIRGDQVLWFFMPLIFWGVAVLIHYVHAIVLFDNWWKQAQATQEALEERTKEKGSKRLSEELHDETLAELASIVVELGWLARRAKHAPSELEASLYELRDRVKHTEERLRQIVLGIFPSVLTNLGLVPALRTFLKELSIHPIDNPTPLRIELNTSGFNDTRLPEEVEIAAYRVIQQAITNAIQHASATKLIVNLAWDESGLRLGVSDDGIGFDAARAKQAPAQGHFGLISLRDRIEGLGGHFAIESHSSTGTSIRARLPTPGKAGAVGEVQNSVAVLGAQERQGAVQ